MSTLPGEPPTGGTRRYSDSDIARLHRIAALIGDGINLTGIARVLDLEADNADLHAANTGLRSTNTNLRTSNAALQASNSELEADNTVLRGSSGRNRTG